MMARHTLPTVRVAIAVIEQDGRYLISRRKPSDHLGGYWEFPGGKRRVGESWAVCLRRELREELGIAVTLLERLEPIRFRYPDRRIYLEVFRCKIKAGTPQVLGCESIRWVRPAQLRRHRFPPADRRLIRALSMEVRLSHHLFARRRCAIRTAAVPPQVGRPPPVGRRKEVVRLHRLSPRGIMPLNRRRKP